MPELTVQEALSLAADTLARPDFVYATLKQKDDTRVTARPVELRGTLMFQVVSFDGTTTDTKNYGRADFFSRWDELIEAGIRSVHVVASGDDLLVQFSKKGRPIVHRKQRAEVGSPQLTHDRVIARPLPEGEPDHFLQTIGLMTQDGRIKADRQRKFLQINEFIRLAADTADLRNLSADPLLIVDFGCGNAYLSFGLHHYLTQKLGVSAELIGVDRTPEAIERNRAKATELGTPGIAFVASSIADFQSARPADIVTALHACDTATDESLAKAVEYKAKLIFAAPCCHHQLQTQLSRSNQDLVHLPLMRDGIMKERLGDLLTDTFRSLLLRIAGYRVDIIEFISPEHTAKNLMIRAVYAPGADTSKEIAEYEALKKSFSVTPFLEGLLPQEVRDQLGPVSVPAE